MNSTYKLLTVIVFTCAAMLVAPIASAGQRHYDRHDNRNDAAVGIAPVLQACQYGNENQRPDAQAQAVTVIPAPGVFRAGNQSGTALFALEHLHRLAGHDCRNRVLVDKLRMPVPAKENAEIVKGCDDTRELHAIDQENRERILVLADCIEEKILKILGTFSHFLFFHRVILV